MSTTRKKTKVIGIQEYINTSTGELKEMQVISVEERDANFHKIWIWHMANALELIGNQKVKILCHIIENLTRENIFIGTQRKIAKDLKMSLSTVIITLKALQEANFLTMKQNGVYQVNPNMIFKGGKGDRMSVLIEYVKNKEEGEDEEGENVETEGNSNEVQN